MLDESIEMKGDVYVWTQHSKFHLPDLMTEAESWSYENAACREFQQIVLVTHFCHKPSFLHIFLLIPLLIYAKSVDLQ